MGSTPQPTLRVLHFLPVYAPAWQYGGPVLSVSRLCEGLAAQGAAVRVISTDAGLPEWPRQYLGRPMWRNGVEIIRYPVDDQRGSIRSRALELAVHEAMAGVDLLHLSAVWQPLGLPVQRAALQRGLPILHSLRGALGPYSFRHGWWKKWPYFLLCERPLLQRASGLHVTSSQEERELRGLGLRAPRYRLPNPLDLGELRPDPELGRLWRLRHGLPGNVPLLLICGRQHHKKGLDLLADALPPLAGLAWQLLLVGSDEDGSGARLAASLARCGLAGRLRCMPTLPASELAAVYNAADSLLMPSRHENFGNVVVEALACGCTVVVSDRTGVAADLIRDAPPGFGVVLPRQPRLWQRWLEGWLASPSRAGETAARWAAQHYGQHTLARRAIEIYRQILQYPLH